MKNNWSYHFCASQASGGFGLKARNMTAQGNALGQDAVSDCTLKGCDKIFPTIFCAALSGLNFFWHFTQGVALGCHVSRFQRGVGSAQLVQVGRTKFNLIFALAACLALAGCSKSGGDKPADAPEKAEVKPGVTMDAETQERIGLKIETPVATQWQPELHAVGRVADPLGFTAAAADYETARAAAGAAQNELERTQKLAAQDNASPRALEAAQAAAARDSLALKSARAKFTADWGVQLAAQANLTAFAEKLQTDDTALVKISLPVGTFPNPLPAEATIFIFNRETNSFTAAFADDLRIDPATQVQTLLFAVNKKLPPGISVTAALKISGAPVGGVIVPAGAVLRHEGKGWVYVQTATNQFLRVEVPLDRRTDSGWFVAEDLSATNRIVTSGAQTVLSTELSAHAAP